MDEMYIEKRIAIPAIGFYPHEPISTGVSKMDEMYIEKRTAIPAIGFYPHEPISTGTTLIAMEFDGGVVVGTDSRTSSGSFIASRATDKITPITDRLVVCRSGSAADTQAIADIVKYYIEVYSLMENEEIGVSRASQIFRNFLYRYRDDLSASVLVAGYDDDEGGQLYAIPLGGYVTRQRCTASGSGSTFVQGFLDNHWKRIIYVVVRLMENEEIGVSRASQIFRNFLYRYRDDLSASVLVAGYDDDEGGQLYAIPLGGYVTRQRCTASGSGSTFVQGFLDNHWKPGLNADQCKEIVKTAVGLATYRDGSSGGVIRLAVVDKNGTTRTLIRPDTNQFPKFVDIPAHPSFPKHIVQ
uniref:proteasome endopeptidase complex n=2 Tax=Ascaris TaxID=6251 RepID=A0A0M3I9B4_ASCLU